MPTLRDRRKIQEHHDAFPKYVEGTLPLGLAHTPPRGHQLTIEDDDEHEVKLMYRKQTGILRVLFDM
eukprot:3578149-Amphidinium_carterae.1